MGSLSDLNGPFKYLFHACLSAYISIQEVIRKTYMNLFQGGVISIDIEWNCDLDHAVSNCRPKYSFSRMDDPNAKLAAGWNFR